MRGVNKVILVGTLGRDVEVRYLPSGDAVASLSLATSESWKDKSGQKQEATEWHRISFFGKSAEVLGQHGKKGGRLYVEGSINTRKFTDKHGVEKYSTEVKGAGFQFLGGGERQESADTGDAESDIPF